MRRLSLVCLLAASSAVQAQQFGIESNGAVWNFSTNSLIGQSGLANVGDAMFHNGKLHAVAGNNVYEVSVSTGAAVLKGTLNLGGATDVVGSSFDLDGDLYVVVDKPGSDQLWRVNPATWVGSPVGLIGDDNIRGLQFDFTGMLFAWSTTGGNAGGLWRVNLFSGLGTDVNPALGAQVPIESLYQSGSTIRGARDSVYLIDKSTGQVTQLFNGGYTDVRGAASAQEFFSAGGFQLRLGRLAQGNAASLLRSDGLTLQVCRFIVPNQQVAPVNVEFSSQAGASTGRSLEFIVNSRMMNAGSFQVTAEMFNFQTNTWGATSAQAIGTSWNFTVSSTNSPSSFISPPNNLVLGRVLVRQTGPSAVVTWCWECDQVVWDLIQ